MTPPQTGAGDRRRGFRAGDQVWTHHASSAFRSPATVVRAFTHRGARFYVVELRAAPDVILGVRDDATLFGGPG